MTSRRAARAALLLVLGGCSLFRGPPPVADDENTPAHRACREEARISPQVYALERERNTLNASNTQRIDDGERAARNRAYRDCLRREGLALPGGVEAPRSR